MGLAGAEPLLGRTPATSRRSPRRSPLVRQLAVAGPNNEVSRPAGAVRLWPNNAVLVAGHRLTLAVPLITFRTLSPPVLLGGLVRHATRP